ncbi:MAG: hypothetical protein ACE1Y4_15085, partial [Lysobacterales bacterium]
MRVALLFLVAISVSTANVGDRPRARNVGLSVGTLNSNGAPVGREPQASAPTSRDTLASSLAG